MQRPSKKLVLASGNKAKLQELSAILEQNKARETGLELCAQSQFGLDTAEETGLSFVENAILKARYVAEKTGHAAIADDSGLEVDALQGRPGIYSARYAGENASDRDNLNKLLLDMQGIAEEQRQCRFHCLIVYLQHAADPTPLICHGIWEGMLLTEPVGENGFGYDPIFYLPDQRCSSAQLSAQQKNRISHRGQALQQLVQCLFP